MRLQSILESLHAPPASPATTPEDGEGASAGSAATAAGPFRLFHHGGAACSVYGAGDCAALEAALRAGGCLDLHEVERATIETNGQITVVLRRRESAAR